MLTVKVELMKVKLFINKYLLLPLFRFVDNLLESIVCGSVLAFYGLVIIPLCAFNMKDYRTNHWYNKFLLKTE